MIVNNHFTLYSALNNKITAVKRWDDYEAMYKEETIAKPHVKDIDA